MSNPQGAGQLTEDEKGLLGKQVPCVLQIKEPVDRVGNVPSRARCGRETPELCVKSRGRVSLRRGRSVSHHVCMALWTEAEKRTCRKRNDKYSTLV